MGHSGGVPRYSLQMLGASTDSRPSDRRQHSRKVIPFPVTLLLGSEGQGRLIDLSEGGMSVQGKMPPSLIPGARLRIELSSGSIPIEVGCELVWAEASGKSGMRFLIMSETSQQELKKLLSQAPGLNLPTPPPLTGVSRVTGSQVATPTANPIANPIRSGIAKWRDEELEIVSAVRHAAQHARAAGDPALTFLTERACKLGQADGAAIVLLEGAGFFCRAITGMAPPCGTQIQANSALSAECLRSGQLVHCDDASTDPRVDPEVYRQLNMRSVIVVPIHSGGKIIGLLEMFSTQAHAFDTLDLLSLRLIAESAGAVVTSDARPATPILSAISFSGTSSAAEKPKPEPKARMLMPGILVCDVCGCENSIERVHVCRECDVPLPTAQGLPQNFTAEVMTEGNPVSSSSNQVLQPVVKKAPGGFVKTYLAALLFGVLLLPVLRHWRAQHWGDAFSSVQASEVPASPADAQLEAHATLSSNLAEAPVIARAGDEGDTLQAKTFLYGAPQDDHVAPLDDHVASPGVNVASPAPDVASAGVHVAWPGAHDAPPRNRSRSFSRIPQRDFLTPQIADIHAGGAGVAPGAEFAAQIPSRRARGIMDLAPMPRLAAQPAKTNEGMWKRFTGILSRYSRLSHSAETKH